MKDIVDLVAELEDIVLKQNTYEDALHEADVFLQRNTTLDNEGYLQYRARYVLSNFRDIKAEV